MAVRKVHQPDCLCAACKARRKKAAAVVAEPEEIVEEVAVETVAEPTFGSLAVGATFSYPVFRGQTYKKCNARAAVNTTTPLPGGNLSTPFKDDDIVKPR